MKIRNLLLLLCIFGIHAAGNAQRNPVGKGSKLIMGLANFSSTKSDNSSERQNSLAVSTSVDHFFGDNAFVGIGINGFSQSTRYGKSTGLGFGPEIGYAFGNKNSSVFPFIVGGSGIKIYNINSNSQSVYGLDLSLGMGLIIPIKKNFGLVVQGKFNSVRYADLDYYNDSTLSLNFGFIGLFF